MEHVLNARMSLLVFQDINGEDTKSHVHGISFIKITYHNNSNILSFSII